MPIIILPNSAHINVRYEENWLFPFDAPMDTNMCLSTSAPVVDARGGNNTGNEMDLRERFAPNPTCMHTSPLSHHSPAHTTQHFSNTFAGTSSGYQTP